MKSQAKGNKNKDGFRYIGFAQEQNTVTIKMKLEGNQGFKLSENLKKLMNKKVAKR